MRGRNKLNPKMSKTVAVPITMHTHICVTIFAAHGKDFIGSSVLAWEFVENVHVESEEAKWREQTDHP